MTLMDAPLYVKKSGVFERVGIPSSGGSGVVLPELTAADHKFAGLWEVPPTGGTASIKVSGAYTVDWGDGSAPTNHAAATIATHTYTYADLSGEVVAGAVRYALVTVTPQAGQSLTTVDMRQGDLRRWADFTVAAASMTSLLAPTGSLSRLRSGSVPANAVASGSGLFQGCTSLTAVPALDASKFTTITNMFQGCTGLTTIPMLDIPLVGTANSTFSGCTSLTTIPPLDTSSVTSMTSTFATCTSLTSAPLVGTRVTHSFAGCALGTDALNAIFTGLATVTGQTITITGNPGAATCDRSIATSKGWTVTG